MTQTPKAQEDVGAPNDAVAIKWSQYIPHEPTVKQLAMLLSSSLEVLYGGAAGGGKTDALLMGALQFADIPGFSALLLRRTYPDLTKADSLIPRSHEWLRGKGPSWNETKKQWTFPSGATIEFGHLQRSNDVYNYHSATYQYIGFDELTSFEEFQYRYMFSRVRKLEAMDVPLRVRAGSNPGGVGHSWVHRRFFVENPTGKRLFIPARLEDNPFIDRETYENSLKELDPVTYAMLRRGDWSARRAGSMFKREWFPIMPDLPKDLTYRKVRQWDLAATEETRGRDPDWTVGALVCLGSDGRWYVEDVVRAQALPGDVEELIRATAANDGKVAIRMEQEPGASGKTVIDHYARRVLVGYDFVGTPSTGNKMNRARPFSAAAQQGNVKLVSGPWNGDLLDELESMPGGSHDDQMDTISAAMAFLKPQIGYADFTQGTEQQKDAVRHRSFAARGLPDEERRYAMTEGY